MCVCVCMHVLVYVHACLCAHECVFREGTGRRAVQVEGGEKINGREVCVHP